MGWISIPEQGIIQPGTCFFIDGIHSIHLIDFNLSDKVKSIQPLFLAIGRFYITSGLGLILWLRPLFQFCGVKLKYPQL